MSRIDKLNEEFRHLISSFIQRELKDPRLGFITITSVSIAPDLKNATVFFTCLGDDDAIGKALGKLNKASGFIRKLIGKHLYIKFTPGIKFCYDDTAQQEEKINRLFDQIHREENKGG